ncbi:quinone oxidoreductase family protein [Tessaracoccus palaemonis]|nr:zinc-binding alcohol dehydrogenase family protein [Tessaracoccus palaemonis]
MKAVVISSPQAGPVCGDFSEPVPGQGEQVFELVGAGLHQIVRSIASGSHYGSGDVYPFVPGVDAVARGVDGGLVYTGFITEPWGTMAERMSARVGIRVPDGADPLAVAAGMNPGMSSWLPLTARADRGPLGTVLIFGATGASGRIAVQSALSLGADRVVAVGRNAAVLEELAGPSVVTVRLGEEDTATRLAAALDPAPSLVLDYLWGPVAELAFGALARRGLDEDSADITYTQIGGLAGPTAAVPASLLRSRRIRIVGSGAGSASTADLLKQLPGLLARIADGRIQVAYKSFSLADAAAAWAHRGPERAVLVP